MVTTLTKPSTVMKKVIMFASVIGLSTTFGVHAKNNSNEMSHSSSVFTEASQKKTVNTSLRTILPNTSNARAQGQAPNVSFEKRALLNRALPYAGGSA